MSTENTHYGASAIGDMLSGCRSIYFIGIGGVSMSSLAHISLQRGFRTGGSDRCASAITERLRSEGVEIFIGHSTENIGDYDAAVYTVAISRENPEYTEALRRGIPLISRADYLGYIMTGWRRRLGISGMHGKSTCTSMCAAVYMAANADPTVVSGADYPAMGGYYRIGGGDDFVFEACEYMDSFLDFNPTEAVILNIELEHVDYFGTLDRICESYGRFAALTGDNGTVIYNSDDPNIKNAIAGYKGKRVTFGLRGAPDYTAGNLDTQKCRPAFDIYCHDKLLCHVDLSIPGIHNVYNALAAAAAAHTDGISPEAIAKGLSSFTGARRRMEFRGTVNGCDVYDDYGHHPTEIAATLDGARRLCGGKRLVCAFQPHTYSRTAALFDDFVSALGIADRILLAPVYAARETDCLGVSSQKLARTIAAKGKNAEAYESVEALAAVLNDELCEGDLAVIMGAGNIDEIYGLLKTEDFHNVK